jgi:cytochrome b subunit of formate dehydrogenase
MGFQRFRSLHLQQKCSFPWKKHVFWGTLVLSAWILGPFTGLAGAYSAWRESFMAFNVMHIYVGFVMLPLAIVGYLTGRRLDKVRKRRKWLPVVHGVNNILLLILAFWQIYSGMPLLDFLPS